MAADNGNGGLTGLGKLLIGALPPAFLVLCVILALLLWFADQRADQRAHLLETIIDRCMIVSPK